MRPSLLLFSLFLAVAGPISAVAASGNTETPSLVPFISAVNALQTEGQTQSREEAVESRPEVLPMSQTGAVVVRESSSSNSFLSVVVDGQDTTFRDVGRDTWFAPFVLSVLQQGWMSGYRDEHGSLAGLFGPDDSVTLEQLAKVAVEVSGRDSAQCSAAGTLLSVEAIGRWSETYIRCAETLGWAVYSDGSESLGRPALRREVVATMLQAFGVEPLPASGAVFIDVQINLPFAAFVERAAADHVVGGYTGADGQPTGKFGPSDPVNRAALAKILLNAEAAYGQR